MLIFGSYVVQSFHVLLPYDVLDTNLYMYPKVTVEVSRVHFISITKMSTMFLMTLVKIFTNTPVTPRL